jgi:hypothetical protein
VLVTEHESGHGKLVLLVVSEPQYYEFALFIQCLIRKRQQPLDYRGYSNSQFSFSDSHAIMKQSLKKNQADRQV